MNEIDAEAARIQASIHRKLTGSERMRIAFEMSLTTRELARTRLRRQHPVLAICRIPEFGLYRRSPGPLLAGDD